MLCGVVTCELWISVVMDSHAISGPVTPAKKSRYCCDICRVNHVKASSSSDSIPSK